jgi:hypothetical protein
MRLGISAIIQSSMGRIALIEAMIQRYQWGRSSNNSHDSQEMPA